MVKIMEKVSAANNLLIGVFIVSFSVTFIILLNPQGVSVNAEKPYLPQTNTSDTANTISIEADISVNSASKKISNTVISGTNTINTSGAAGKNETNATIPMATVPDSSDIKSRPLPTRPKEAHAAESRKSTLHAHVRPMNISTPSMGLTDSLSAKVISPESSPSSKDFPSENKLDPDDLVGSPNPRADTNHISGSSDQRALETDLSLTETRPPHWHIYEQRRLAICDQLISKWMKSGKSLY